MIRYYCDRCDKCITHKNVTYIKITKTGPTNCVYEYMLCEKCYELVSLVVSDSNATVRPDRFLNPRG